MHAVVSDIPPRSVAMRRMNFDVPGWGIQPVLKDGCYFGNIRERIRQHRAPRPTRKCEHPDGAGPISTPGKVKRRGAEFYRSHSPMGNVEQGIWAKRVVEQQTNTFRCHPQQHGTR